MSNLGEGIGYRNAVLLALHEAGLNEAHQLPPAERLALDVEGKACTIAGLPWVLMTRVERRPDLSGGVRDATAIGRQLGYEHSAVVLPRRGYPVQDSYIVTTINEFIPVLQPAASRRTA